MVNRLLQKQDWSLGSVTISVAYVTLLDASSGCLGPRHSVGIRADGERSQMFMHAYVGSKAQMKATLGLLRMPTEELVCDQQAPR